MYSIEELHTLREEMSPETRGRLEGWFTERDIAEYKDLLAYWSESPLIRQTAETLVDVLYTHGILPTEAIRIVTDMAVSFAVGVQYGYEIRQRQELSRVPIQE